MGSPRQGGNSELLLNEAIKALNQSSVTVKTFRLNDLDIFPCLNCGDCDDDGVCSTVDDMSIIYEAIRENDRFIIVSPIFFSSVPAQVKLMIDRCQCLWCEKYLLHKPIEPNIVERKGLLVLVGGMKRGMGSECAAQTVKSFYRSISIQKHEVLIFDHVDSKAQILEHPDALQQVALATKRLVEDI